MGLFSRLVGKHRGAVNIIATMFIFAIMISALGVLYAQISPTLLGYQTQTTSINQEFIMKTIAQEMFDLAGSTSGSQGRIHIISDETTFDVSRGQNINITVQNLTGGDISYSRNIGEFISIVNGSFLPSSSPSYLNRIISEDTYVQNSTVDSAENYVSKAEYSRNQGLFTLYFRPRLSISNTTSGFVLTIIFLQINFLESLDSSPLNFPIEQDEWTLRMRRQDSIVNSISDTLSGQLVVNHTSDGTAGQVYNFPATTLGNDIEIKEIIIPILFTI